MHNPGDTIGSMKRTTALAAGLGLAGTIAYLQRERIGTWVSTWGSTAEEAAETLPGDDVTPQAGYVATHAVTIDATPEQVWPWVAQLGQGRGGLYSYDRLENLLGLQIHSLDHIDPGLQDLSPGDQIRLVPEGTEPDLAFEVHLVEPPHVLLLGPHGSKDETLTSGLPWPTWAFVLRPITHSGSGDGGTRLIVRFRSEFAPTPVATLTNKIALGPIHLLMERKMLLGIKERAERGGLVPFDSR